MTGSSHRRVGGVSPATAVGGGKALAGPPVASRWAGNGEDPMVKELEKRGNKKLRKEEPKKAWRQVGEGSVAVSYTHLTLPTKRIV